MDRLNQLRGEAGTSGDSTLDTSSPPSEAYLSANESSSKYFSLSDVDSTFDISPIKEVSIPCASASTISSERAVNEPDGLMSKLSPIGKKNDFLDTYKIGEQIEAANILSGGVAIFDDNDNSYDGDELVIDDNAEIDDKVNVDTEAEVLDHLLTDVVPDNASAEVISEVPLSTSVPKDISSFIVSPDKVLPKAAISDNNSPKAMLSDIVSQVTTKEDKTSLEVSQPGKIPLEATGTVKISTDTIVSDITSHNTASPDNSSDVAHPDNVTTEAAVSENITSEAASANPETSNPTEVILQIDGIKVDATDIGNGLYLFRRQGKEELEAVQIYNNQEEPSFQFLKVRENADRKLEVYEEIEVEVPNEMSSTDDKSINECQSADRLLSVKNNTPHKDPTSSNMSERKEKDDISANIQNNLNNELNKDSFIGKLDSFGKKMSECRKSPVVSSFTSVAYHSTPNKDGIPLTKAMVDLQLHPNRYSDNVKKTIEVHTDSSKQRNLGISRVTTDKKESDTKNNVLNETSIKYEESKQKDIILKKEKTIETNTEQINSSSGKEKETTDRKESDIDEKGTSGNEIINTTEKSDKKVDNHYLPLNSNRNDNKVMLENKKIIVTSIKEFCKQNSNTEILDNNYNKKLIKDISPKCNENISTTSNTNKDQANDVCIDIKKIHETVEGAGHTVIEAKKDKNNETLADNGPIPMTDLNVKDKIQADYTHDMHKNSSRKHEISSNINSNTIIDNDTHKSSGTTITKETALLIEQSSGKESVNSVKKSCDPDDSKSSQPDKIKSFSKLDILTIDGKLEICNEPSVKTVNAETKVGITASSKTLPIDAASVTKEELKALPFGNKAQASTNPEIKPSNNQESKPVITQKMYNNDNTDNIHIMNSIDINKNNNSHVDVPFGKWTDANRQAFLNRFKEIKVPSTSSNGKQIKNSNDLNRRDILKKIDSKRHIQTNANTVKIQDFGSMSRLCVKNDASVFSCKQAPEESTVSLKTETRLINKEAPFRKVIHLDVPNNTNLQFDVNTVSKKEPSQRKEIHNQELIDKTIEGIINRAIPNKSHDDIIHTASEQTRNVLQNKNTKGSKNESPKGLDEIEMKMNELHGMPFIERPPHELPHVSNFGLKTYTRIDIQKALTKSKIPSLIPFAKNQSKSVKENIIDIESEDEVIEHEPITGDMDVSKKDVLNLTIIDKVESLPHTKDFSKKEAIITEKDFDKFYRRNSVNCDNIMSVKLDRKQSSNVLHTLVQKGTVLKTYSKNDLQQNQASTPILNERTDPVFNEENPPSSEHSDANISSSENTTSNRTDNQNDVASEQVIDPSVTVIDNKPVKVVYVANENTEFDPSLLNVQGEDLSPTKEQPTNPDTVTSNTSQDSDILEIQEEKTIDETKTKVKHQRKQVLTPVETSDLELIEPDDLRIDLSPKKKRKTEEGVEKVSKALVPKKSYLLGRSSVTDDSNDSYNVLESFEKVSVIQEEHHNNTAAAIDSLVKAAELLETQSGSIITTQIQSSESQINTPIKRGRGRPRKYPLPDASENKHNSPSPQKKPRLRADIRVINRKDSTDDEGDDLSSDGEIVKENWTMGKINENIVCPICDKLFRSENVVFKHVKHCTGPSPNRSESSNKSPRRNRESQDSETRSSKSDDMETDRDEMSQKDVPHKRKSRDSRPKSLTTITEKNIMEDTSLKEKSEKQNEPREVKKSALLPRNINNLVCEFCGKIFRQRSYLASHKIQHEQHESLKLENRNNSAKSAISCEICKKQFRKPHHLAQHRIIHNPVNVSSGKITRKNSLEQNYNKTTKDQKLNKQSDDTSAGFRCEPCDKSFRKLHHLVEHRETHDCMNRQKISTNEQPNTLLPPPQCEVCKKTFRKLHHLIEHKEQHHEASREKSDNKSIRGSLSTKDIIHECSLCYMVFPNEHSLTKHTIICQRKKRQAALKQAKQANEKNTHSDDVTDNKLTEKAVSNKEDKDEELIVLETEASIPIDTTEVIPAFKTEQEKNCLDEGSTLTLAKVSPKPSETISNQGDCVKVTSVIVEKDNKEAIDLPNIANKVDDIVNNKSLDTPKEKNNAKKTFIKDKVAPTVTKHRRSNLSVDIKPSEMSDDDEVRYMFNPDYKANESKEAKLFMKVRANKRSSLQFEQPNSKGLVKRRISSQHLSKVPRLKAKLIQTKVLPINALTNTKQVKSIKLDPVHSTDSDDSDVKYSFPKSVIEKITKLRQEGGMAEKQQDKKVKRKSLTEKRKSLSNIAKKKTLVKTVSANLKKKMLTSPVKIVKKRFINTYEKIISDCSDQITCVLGDFNLGDLRWSPKTMGPLNYSCEKAKVIYNLFQSNNLFQINFVANHNGKVLDPAITNNLEMFTLRGAVSLSRLDMHHPPFELDCCVEIPSLKPNDILKKLCYRRANYEACIKDLQQIDWQYYEFS
ncbi:hypothetical protein ACJJTC_018637 [Scirpophaga incertulas]